MADVSNNMRVLNRLAVILALLVQPLCGYANALCGEACARWCADACGISPCGAGGCGEAEAAQESCCGSPCEAVCPDEGPATPSGQAPLEQPDYPLCTTTCCRCDLAPSPAPARVTQEKTDVEPAAPAPWALLVLPSSPTPAGVLERAGPVLVRGLPRAVLCVWTL